ncbi:hypothetical protein AUJ84_04130 [Candidatus Pacearchaeota archaeon CG1_02_32_132]|nr:MAG: hypothetical protein AUJ84_04130 [Candidatus Pacearchaeota archaeon CG1_02_32_132]
MAKKETKIERVDLKSRDIVANQKEKLRQLFPEIFSEDKVNFEKLKKTLGENVDESQERYEMTWAGKTNCFKIIQESSLGTLKPIEKESINWGETQNLFIEGDNLEVLKLLQKSYNEKIKMIYIDPPYNTGHDFVYKDKFGQQLDDYLKLTGQVDEEGKALSTNTDADGRYHSNWMNMMYPRLFLARNLLKEEGVIFISIDDNEVDNLKKVCNEIFGEENLVAQLVWKKKAGGGNDTKYFAIDHEYILCYAKNIISMGRLWIGLTEEQRSKYVLKDEFFDERGPYQLKNLYQGSIAEDRPNLKYPITCPDGSKLHKKKDGGLYRWRWEESRFLEGVKDSKIEFKKINGEWQVFTKQYLYDGEDGDERMTKPRSILLKEGMTRDGKEELKSLFDKPPFDFPKPTKLIKHLMSIMTNSDSDEIILDFFAGSGTTAHAVLELNKEENGRRKFILVQLPEPTNEDSEAFKTGYKHIAHISQERIKRVIKRIKEEQKEAGKQKKIGEENKTNNLDLGFKVFQLDKSNFKIWDAQTRDIQTALNEHINPIRKESSQEDVLYELILKSGLSLTTDIKEIKVGNKKLFSIEDGMLLICLEKELTSELIKKIAEMKPARFYCLDDGFKGNDQLKANAVEIFKNVETVDGEKIVFRTV